MTPNNDFLDNLGNDQHQKMLREIANDDLTPKNTILRCKKRFMRRFAMMMTMMTGIMVQSLQY